MNYISTRGNSEKVSASQAILNGMVSGGGLYLPDSIPKINLDQLKEKINFSYNDIAKWILELYLDDFSKEEIAKAVDSAYNLESFDTEEMTPVVKLEEDLYILELWHGPTAAFKDMALQLTPHLLVESMKKSGIDKKVLILVATSGDTGKAALEGFKNVENTEIIVFYPNGGVSQIQELQMLTTDGLNTHVLAVEGNFDDCQSAVKEIFSDQTYEKTIDALGYQFSSANSINWGRLLPQIVYYFSAYFQLVRRDQIKFGDKVNFAVPTGNFGNILAAWYAKEMGLPVEKLVCASNANDVLKDFFNTGVYDKNRDFLKTISPSMDILISSNLERFLYLINGCDSAKVCQYMTELKENGKFSVDEATKKAMDELIIAGACDDQTTKETIKKIFDEDFYLLDPHTAVGVNVVKNQNLNGAVIVDATANPYKFFEAVAESLDLEKEIDNEDLKSLDSLAQATQTKVHKSLSSLINKGQKPREVITVAEMKEAIKKILTK